MRIRMKTTMAGPAGGASVGQVIDRPKAEAYALIEGGFAEQIESETADVVAPETAEAAPSRRGRNRRA